MTDFDRPLNTRGIKDAGAMPLRLLSRIQAIDAFITSPALRAKTTAEKFIAAFNRPADQLVQEKGLYLAAPSFYTQFISNLDDRLNTIALFAHNPGITDYANTLSTAIRTDNMPTCSIFAVAAAISSWKDFETAAKAFLFYDYPKLLP